MWVESWLTCDERAPTITLKHKTVSYNKYFDVIVNMTVNKNKHVHALIQSVGGELYLKL